jgi:thiamine biosynthesis lipoprotein
LRISLTMNQVSLRVQNAASSWQRRFAAIIFITTIAAAQAETTPIRLQKMTEAMGTAFTIDMYGSDRAGMEKTAKQAFEEAHRLDRMLSNYIPDSELNRVNAQAADAPVKISPELFHLLSICIGDSKASDGTFDITVGPLMKVWGFYEDSGHLADVSFVREALRSVGWQYMTLNPIASTVSFKRRGMNLEMGGVGKGYAVDRMVQILRQRGVTAALISAGGSSIYGLGAPPTEPRGWRLRIRDPKDEGKHVAEVYLKDDSLSTSGSYEKFFWADGKIYSHIMDPRTGFPSQGMLSVSIVAPKTLDSEIWAKPYYILGRAWTEQHKPKSFRVLLCEDRPGATCSWLE